MSVNSFGQRVGGLRSRRLFSVAAICAVAWLSGCESKQENNLAKAQACLDKATPSTAEACMAHVSGDESQKAYLIRCAATYIKNGFVGEKIASAFSKIKENSSGGTDPMISAMGFMAFSTQADADTVSNYCTKSGVLSLERLALMSKMATFIAVNGSLGSITTGNISEADMTTAINNVKNAINANTLPPETLGQLAVQANAAYCAEGSQFATNAVCKNLTAAVAAGNIADVAKELLNQLQTN